MLQTLPLPFNSSVAKDSANLEFGAKSRNRCVVELAGLHHSTENSLLLCDMRFDNVSVGPKSIGKESPAASIS
jgi:hypothetical protein